MGVDSENLTCVTVTNGGNYLLLIMTFSQVIGPFSMCLLSVFYGEGGGREGLVVPIASHQDKGVGGEAWVGSSKVITHMACSDPRCCLRCVL